MKHSEFGEARQNEEQNRYELLRRVSTAGGNFDSHFSVTFFGSLSPILYVKFHLNFDQEN